MKLIHKGQEVTPTLEDGRYFYEYMPSEIKEEIILQHDGQIGDWVLEQVQINEGEFEKYEPNENTESQLGAAFRHINELRSFVRDEDGNLTRFTKETLKSTFSVYQDILAGTSNETLESDEGLYRVIQNTLTQDYTRFIQDDSTFASEVGKLIGEDAEIEYEEVDVEFFFASHEGMNAGTYFSNYNYYYFDVVENMEPSQVYPYRFNVVASQNNGQRYDLHWSANGTTWTQLWIGNLTVGQSSVTGLLNLSSAIPADSQLRLTIHNYSRYVSDFGIYQMRTAQVPIENQHTGAISSQIVQMYNHINLALFGVDGALARISVGEKGITLKGEHIYLDGKVSMDEAFVETLLAKDITADTITAANATFARLIAVSIDALDITTNRFRAIEAAFQSWESYVRINGTGVWVNRNDGSRSVRMTQRGLEIQGPYGRVGEMAYGSTVYRTRPSLFFNWERNHDLFFGVVGTGSAPNTAAPSLIMRGASDEGIELYKPLLAGDTNYGININQQSITGEGTGVAISASALTNVAIAFMPSGVWFRSQSHGWRNLTTWATGN